MNVIGNRCTAQTNFHKLHRRGRALFAHTHLTAMRAHTVRPYGIAQSIHTNETIAIIFHSQFSITQRKKKSEKNFRTSFHYAKINEPQRPDPQR